MKDTQGLTYVFSRRINTELDNKISKPKYLGDNYCSYCRVGPFYTIQDKQNHLTSKKHQKMALFEQQWLNEIDQFEE